MQAGRVLHSLPGAAGAVRCTAAAVGCQARTHHILEGLNGRPRLWLALRYYHIYVEALPDVCYLLLV